MVKCVEIEEYGTQKILEDLPDSIITLLEAVQQKYDKSLSETEKSGESYVGNYIKRLVKLAEILDSHVQNNPSAAKEVLQSINLIAQKGYPHLYINVDFHDSSDYLVDSGMANCDSEIDLSSSLRKAIRNVVDIDPSLLNDACTVVQNIKDCSEKVYFLGSDYGDAVFENAQKRNFLQWMKNKMAGNGNDISKNGLIYETNGYFTNHTSLEYNAGILTCRYEVTVGDDHGGYTETPREKSCYLSNQERVLVEKIIETKNPDLLKKLTKLVKNDTLELKRLEKICLKYQQNQELNNSKLAKVRQRVAEKVGIKTQLPKPIKKIEKTVSDKLFGKVKE